MPQVGNPNLTSYGSKRYTREERMAINKRLSELMKEGGLTLKRMADIMTYEGFRTIEGKEITSSWINQRKRMLLKRETKKKLNSAGPVRDVYAPKKTPPSQAGRVRRVEGRVETNPNLDAVYRLAKSNLDNSSFGAAVRALLNQ